MLYLYKNILKHSLSKLQELRSKSEIQLGFLSNAEPRDEEALPAKSHKSLPPKRQVSFGSEYNFLLLKQNLALDSN